MAQGQMSLAREIAFDAYMKIMEEGAPADEALDELYEKHSSKLKRLDRNFIKEVVYGSLRWHAKILWILQNTSSRDLKDTSPEIRAALVCGTYQIFYMSKVPDRAAVNESVEYVRIRGQANAVKFVNGILRQIGRRAEYFAKPDKKTHQADYLALQFSHPKWIVERWLQAFKFPRMEGMLSENNKPPPWFVRVNMLKTDLKEINILQQTLLREERVHTERRPLRCSLIFKDSPPLGPDSLFAKGFYTIQDEASQLIAYLVSPGDGDIIVDAAAGPGGKLSHLYELSEGKAKILAIEPGDRAFARIKENLERLEIKDIELLQMDFLEWKPETVTPNKILLDAPCSGLGVLRRHPEGKWHKSYSLLTRMAEGQRKLIAHAYECLPVGGELIYSVCSFEPEETSDQLRWLMSQHGDKIEIISPVSRLPDYYKRYVTRDNLLLVYSGNQDGMDGFGAFMVRKKAL